MINPLSAYLTHSRQQALIAAALACLGIAAVTYWLSAGQNPPRHPRPSKQNAMTFTQSNPASTSALTGAMPWNETFSQTDFLLTHPKDQPLLTEPAGLASLSTVIPTAKRLAGLHRQAGAIAEQIVFWQIEKTEKQAAIAYYVRELESMGFATLPSQTTSQLATSSKTIRDPVTRRFVRTAEQLPESAGDDIPPHTWQLITLRLQPTNEGIRLMLWLRYPKPSGR